MEKERLLKDLIKEEKLRGIFDKVFDEPTIMAVYRIAKKGYFNFLEFVISTGKEAHVFRAQDNAGNFLAVKIYKIKTSDFKNMEKYIKGDFRFKGKRSTKKDIVFTWAKKEFKNLSLAKNAGANVPMPIFLYENVLVMEFIGEETAAKTLKETKVQKQQLDEFYEQTIDFMARIFFKKELVHADLSEYNILVHQDKLFFIDMAQSILAIHPRAQEFFERDVKNMATYFTKQGLPKTFEQMRKDIVEKKTTYKKK